MDQQSDNFFGRLSPRANLLPYSSVHIFRLSTTTSPPVGAGRARLFTVPLTQHFHGHEHGGYGLKHESSEGPSVVNSLAALLVGCAVFLAVVVSTISASSKRSARDFRDL
eukprot:g47374.t1